MDLNNLNGPSFKRPEHSGSVKKQQRTEVRVPSESGSSGSTPFKSDSVHITPGRYSSDIEFARDVFDKLESASRKELISVKAALSEGAYGKAEVIDNVADKLAHAFVLERLAGHLVREPELSSIAHLLTPEHQHFLIENDEAVDTTVDLILESLRDL